MEISRHRCYLIENSSIDQKFPFFYLPLEVHNPKGEKLCENFIFYPWCSFLF